MRRNKDTDMDASPAVSTADLEFTGEDPRIDNRIWPGLADVPTGPRASMSAKVADRLFRRAAADLDVRIEYPDGTLVGARREQEILPRIDRKSVV